jgi:predicted metal-dependent enzyme (double-stranded beta helix superfamily)
MIDRPYDRDLEPTELRRLVSGLAARPHLWSHLVRHDPGERLYEELYRDQHVGVWLICWMRDHDTGFHDHDLSAGAIAVVDGQVREDRLAVGSPPTERTVAAGSVFNFRPSDIHRVLHAGDRPAVTIHAYSPPLWRMGAYEIGESGVLQRHSVSYAEELRPIGV